MKVYTSHDASVILKKKTLLKYIKKYELCLKICPKLPRERGIFIVLIEETDSFLKMGFEVDVPSENVVEKNYDDLEKLVFDSNLESYESIVRNDFIEEDITIA